jgi:hypothetical protein
LNKTSPTVAGPTKKSVTSAQKNKGAHSKAAPPNAAHIDAINQVFALFRVNFHNQYYAALGDSQILNQTKKLWADSLSRFSTETILFAAKKVIEESDYLPTLHKMIEYCRGNNSDYGLPDVRQAYLEACHAPSPKTNHQWSHPAVYYAGRDSDWFFLASNNEAQTYPVFKDNYQRWCDKVKAGETLPPIDVKKLTQHSATPLSKTESKKYLQELRKTLHV